jgi:hypothetical protein
MRTAKLLLALALVSLALSQDVELGEQHLRRQKISTETESEPSLLGIANVQNPDATDLKNFQLFAFSSMASYCDLRQTAPKEKEWQCGEICQRAPKLSDISYCTTPERHLAIIGFEESTKNLHLIFRGTLSKSLDNWKTDIDYKRVPYSNCAGCEVHQGFFEAYSGLRKCLVSKYLNYQKTKAPKNVIVTGHSLGGALATLATADMFAADKKHALYLVTYGSPKVGNKLFADWFNEVVKPVKNFRVTHYRDPVPHVPADLQGFQHVGTDIGYNADSTTYQVCATTCYSYGTSPSDHMTYMGYNWDVMRDTPECNYPDRTSYTKPYRDSYLASSYLTCQIRAVGDTLKCKKVVSTGDYCLCRTLSDGKEYCDVQFGEYCFQTHSPTVSEQQCNSACGGFDKCQDNGTGAFCCVEEVYKTNISTGKIQFLSGTPQWCVLDPKNMKVLATLTMTLDSTNLPPTPVPAI